MLSLCRKIAQRALRRWPAAYRRARRGYARLAYHLRVPHDPEFKLFAAIEGARGLFLDVGANTGQSARSLRLYNHSLDILSVEPNHLLEPDLAFTRRLLKTGFEYRMVGLGKSPGHATLSMPTVYGAPQTAWATGDRQILETNRDKIENWLGCSFDVTEVGIEVVRGDDLDLHPVAAKIDVEGFEADVLAGMEETLRIDEPLLMLEHSDGADDLIHWLCRRGYAIYLYEHATNRLVPTAMPRKTTNYFAVTPGWLNRFPGVAALIDEQYSAPVSPAILAR